MDGPWWPQDVWRTVKNNKGRLTPTRVYKFLSPPVHQVCVFSLGCHWMVCPIKDATRAVSESQKDPAALGLCPFSLNGTNIFLPLGPHFFFLLKSRLVRRVHPRCIVRARPFTSSTSASPRSWHAKKANEEGGEKEQRDTANIWKQTWEVTSTLQRLFWGEKKCWVAKEKGNQQLMLDLCERLQMSVTNSKIEPKTPAGEKERRRKLILFFFFF